MSASFGNQGNWGGASSIGGGGNLSQQELRGNAGLSGLGMLGGFLGQPNRALAVGAGAMPQQPLNMDDIKKMLRKMGYTPRGGGGGTNTGNAGTPQPPAPWSFPTLLEAPYIKTR